MKVSPVLSTYKCSVQRLCPFPTDYKDEMLRKDAPCNIERVYEKVIKGVSKKNKERILTSVGPSQTTVLTVSLI